MKKKLILLILMITLFIFLCGCAGKIEQDKDFNSNRTSMFVIIEDNYCWTVVYHKETKVMYTCSKGQASGVFSVLVNPNGTSMLWEK